jgi:hypothetical protein
MTYIFELTDNEALVIFEFLSRFSETSKLDIIDQAESRALWNLRAVLEKQLVEPFMPNYLELLRRARDELRDKDWDGDHENCDDC